MSDIIKNKEEKYNINDDDIDIIISSLKNEYNQRNYEDKNIIELLCNKIQLIKNTEFMNYVIKYNIKKGDEHFKKFIDHIDNTTDISLNHILHYSHDIKNKLLFTNNKLNIPFINLIVIKLNIFEILKVF